MTPPAPPFDPELAEFLQAAPPRTAASIEELVTWRLPTPPEAIDVLLATHNVTREDRQIPGLGSDPAVTVSIFRSVASTGEGPGFFYVHGGGMVMGDRFGADRALEWVDAFGGVAVSIEYRRAPEHPDPAPVNDVYAALVWTAEHAAELGFDPDRLIAVGLSAGGGLLAGAMLMARDHARVRLAAQVLMCPMLDDRNTTVSSQQIDGIGIWERANNLLGWAALLGDRCGADHVSSYSVPARATNLAGLPPTYLDVGSAEVFRDEVVAFASGIWAAGGVAELHVWPGGFHAFDQLAPHATLSKTARDTRTEFVRRIVIATKGSTS